MREERKAFRSLARLLPPQLSRIDEERQARALEKIGQTISASARAIDVAYHILDALHKIVRYDHSAILVKFDAAKANVSIVAEQIRYRKAKSARIGREYDVPWSQVHPPGVAGVIDVRSARGAFATTLFEDCRDEVEPPGAVLWFPLLAQRETLGALAVGATSRELLDARAMSVISRFAPVLISTMRSLREG